MTKLILPEGILTCSQAEMLTNLSHGCWYLAAPLITTSALYLAFWCFSSCVFPQSVPWRMNHTRTELRPRWSVTAVSVLVATGSAPPWPAAAKVFVQFVLRRIIRGGGIHLAKRIPFDLFYVVIFPDKQAAVDESADDGAEMTEEEWNLRVAELNKHQVCICTEWYICVCVQIGFSVNPIFDCVFLGFC